ncbi:uncharacterized protein METZ01_LOCUS364692, partial [marine metagenome]
MTALINRKPHLPLSSHFSPLFGTIFMPFP